MSTEDLEKRLNNAAPFNPDRKLLIDARDALAAAREREEFLIGAMRDKEVYIAELETALAAVRELEKRLKPALELAKGRVHSAALAREEGWCDCQVGHCHVSNTDKRCRRAHANSAALARGEP